MDDDTSIADISTEGRPYRSHIQPACQSCRKRKSRCKTRTANEACIMCQVHGTECTFPQVDDRTQRKAANASRRVTPRLNQSRMSVGRQAVAASTIGSPLSPRITFQQASNQPIGQYMDQNSQKNGSIIENQEEPQVDYNAHEESPSNLMGIFAESGDHSTHIVSPAIAEDNSALESYLTSTPNLRNRRVIRAMPNIHVPSPSVRPVLFNTVLRRPLGVATNQSLASSKCELIEKFIGPYVQDLIDM